MLRRGGWRGGARAASRGIVGAVVVGAVAIVFKIRRIVRVLVPRRRRGEEGEDVLRPRRLRRRVAALDLERGLSPRLVRGEVPGLVRPAQDRGRVRRRRRATDRAAEGRGRGGGFIIFIIPPAGGSARSGG